MKTSGTDGDAMDTRSSQASASFQSGDLVQVELLTESTFADEQGEQDEVIPQGTQLVGVWETKQSAEEGTCAVSINGTTWTFDREDVVLSRLDPACVAWKEQRPTCFMIH